MGVERRQVFDLPPMRVRVGNGPTGRAVAENRLVVVYEYERESNVVQTLDVVWTGTQLLLVLEYVDGDTLNRVLRSAALLAAGGRAHLIGTSGAGMRALTDVLYGAGWRLSGAPKCPITEAMTASARRLPAAAAQAAVLFALTGVLALANLTADPAGGPPKQATKNMAVTNVFEPGSVNRAPAES